MPQATLLLLRHGIAEERTAAQPDAERALSEAGRRRTQAVLRRAAALGLAVERLISSPLLRARQTAEIALAVGLAPALELDAALAPGADPLPLLKLWLEACAATERLGPASADPARSSPSLALVGHEPDLGELAARLIGARAGSLSLRKAGMAQLVFEPEAATEGEPAGAGWRLRLLLAPRLLLG